MFDHQDSSMHPLPRALRFCALLSRAGATSISAVIVLFSGCAQVPNLGPRQKIQDTQALASSTSLQQGNIVGEWPTDAWWYRYNDPQLDALMAEGLRDAPSLKVALARLEKSAALVEKQGAELRPKADLSASTTLQRQSYNNGTPAAFLPKGWNDYGRAAIELRYQVDLWGGLRAELAMASSEWQAAQAEAAQARLVLSSQLVHAYADFSRLFAQTDTANATVDVRRKTLVLMEGRQLNGLENAAAVQQAQSRLAQAEGARLALNESVMLQRHLIAALLGAGPDRGLALQRPRIDFGRVRGLPPKLELDLLGRRPDVVSARLRAEAASHRIDVAHAAFYPNVNISAMLGLQSFGLSMLGHRDSQFGSVGPAIGLPIFDQGRISGQYKQNRAIYDEAVAQYQDTLAKALQDIADVASSEGAIDGRLEQARNATDSAREAWSITKRRYDGGLSTFLDVLSAEDGYLNRVHDLTALEAHMLSLDISLIRALGGGYQR